ncbi:MerR family transcriptional regulator [Promicromonospora sp. NPDC090134]|uniref:MerR family transcriptional regulator n=1 Tax=Promicromonospora sp. NPDC090134 TaxID=3364408 RepID=UPI0037F4922D
MTYTITRVSRLSGVTLKTLYHYDRIGLLVPARDEHNDYRSYSDDDLERLQQILFFRELDMPLDAIAEALSGRASRLECLLDQRTMLRSRGARLAQVLATLEQAIAHERKGEPMAADSMFTGLDQAGWQDALEEQNAHLRDAYGVELDTAALDADRMNAAAAEATAFMTTMADALRAGLRADDPTVVSAIERHLAALSVTHPTDPDGFAGQARFFVADDFHRRMLEQQQTGLAYYLLHAAEAFRDAA